jgi:hypothetical protein
MTAHPSEHQVGRIKFCKSCNRPHMFPRYQAGPHELEPPIPLVRLLNYGLSMLLLWLAVIGWALSEFGDELRGVMG